MVFNVQGTWHQSTNTRHSFSPRRKTDLHNTTGILLKVALNTTKQTNNTLIRNGWPMASRSKSHNSRLRQELNECLVFVEGIPFLI
jgi:hypothetical protein